jgi:Alkylmercury lyase/Sigma-70 region 3
VDAADITLRNATYQLFAASGRAPTPAEIASSMGLAQAEVREGWKRLQDAHALVLDAVGELRMLNPFSVIPTAYRVQAAGREWFANCGWDGFGIGAALGVDSRLETDCSDCGEPIRIGVRDHRPDDESLVFHVLVPAADWWQDIGFT